MIGATPIEATPLFNELLPSNNIVGSWFSPKAGRVIAADGSNRVHEGILDWHAYRLGKAEGKTAEDCATGLTNPTDYLTTGSSCL